MSDPARSRWLAMVASRIAGAGGAVFGIVLSARAPDWPTKALGVAIVVSALAMMAIVPRSLAAKWKSPE